MSYPNCSLQKGSSSSSTTSLGMYTQPGWYHLLLSSQKTVGKASGSRHTSFASLAVLSHLLLLDFGKGENVFFNC